MASSAAEAPSTGFVALQMGLGSAFRQTLDVVEHWLEAEREQLALWLPVLLGLGIAGWFVLPGPGAWEALLLASGAVGLAGLALSGRSRAARALAVAGVMVAAGCVLIWWRAERVAHPVLAGPALATFDSRVIRVEPLPARALVRLTLAPEGRADLPGQLRVNLAQADAPVGLGTGARIRLRARLMPPPPPSIPGAYDFARKAWFDGLGGTGRGLAPVTVLTPGASPGADLRASLSAHIEAQIPGSGGGIASALATGDQGAITEADTRAMQRSGLAHLLSVSGLHVSAVTAAAMLLVLRLMSLSPMLALRLRLPLVAAGAGALAAIGYTLLTGSEVPTVRSCAAALLVLLALSLGREAITLRLVAAGALVVLLLWPEALAGPSFQLSFAAVAAIVALHENPRVHRWFEKREEGRGRRLLRELGSLLLTGLVVELALMPIALYHFHQTGFYGAAANIVAIPLTTFVIMPLEALALVLDAAGLGGPIWWMTARALDLLLWLARTTAGAPGAMASLPAMPGGAYGLMVIGGLWVALWRTRVRIAGAIPLTIGFGWALLTPAPDLLVTGDGRHLAVRTANGGMALLRDRAGDYTRTMLGQNGGVDDDLADLAVQPDARCSPDLCIADVRSAGRTWRIAATRSSYVVPWQQMMATCAAADIVVSERRLPRACHPRWLKLDRDVLARTGGIALSFADGRVRTVKTGSHHPWVDPPTVQPKRERPAEWGRSSAHASAGASSN